MSVIRAFDGKPGVTLWTLVGLFSSVGVFMITKERLFLECFATKSADELLALEHPVLMHFHRLTSFETTEANLTFKLIISII